jgi:hypothetical protein
LCSFACSVVIRKAGTKICLRQRFLKFDLISKRGFTGQEVKPCSVSFVQESYAAQDRTPSSYKKARFGQHDSRGKDLLGKEEHANA